MSVPQGDELVQRAYALAIMPEIIAGDLTEGQQVSFCPVTQQGMCGGQFVPPQVTNEQTYEVGDGLLPSESPVYVPGTGSYITALQTYLSWVDPGGDPSQGALERLTNATNAMNEASANFLSTRISAYAAWKLDPSYPTTSFNSWALQYDKAYGAALSKANSTLGVYDNALSIYGGPQAAQLGVAVAAVNQALTISVDSITAGISMPAVFADWPDMQGYLAQIQKDTTPTLASTQVFARPLYGVVGDYATTTQNWINAFKPGGTPPLSFKIDLDAAQSFQWSQAGYTSVSTDAYQDYWFCVTSEVQANNTTETSYMDTSSAVSDIKMTLTAWGVQKFSLSRGAWDVKNLRTTFPNLMADAPADLIPSMIVPEAVLVGYGVGLSGQFSGAALKSFNSMYESVTSASGKMNILGFDIGEVGANGNFNSTQVTSMSDFSYNSTTGEFNIPAQDNAYPILLAVLGQTIEKGSPTDEDDDDSKIGKVNGGGY